MSKQITAGYDTMWSPDSSALFYHHGLLADIDADGFLDLVTVGERRTLGVDRQVIDDAQAQWFRGEPSATRFETTPRPIGPGMGSLAELVDVDGDGDTDILSAEYFAPFAEKVLCLVRECRSANRW